MSIFSNFSKSIFKPRKMFYKLPLVTEEQQLLEENIQLKQENKRLKDENVELSKLNKKYFKELQKYMPKNKSEDELIKQYIRILKSKEKAPTIDDLDSWCFSRSSWNYKLNDEFFLARLISNIQKKIEYKLFNKYKDIFIECKLQLENKKAKILAAKQKKDEENLNKTKSIEYNENIKNNDLGDEITEIFNEHTP